MTPTRIAILLAYMSAGFLIYYLVTQSIVLAGGVLMFAGLLAFTIRWPEMGTLVVLFSIYSNISVLAMRSQHAIQLTAGAPDKNPRIAIILAGLSLFLLVPFVFHLFIRKERVICDRGFVLMLALLGAYLASSFFAGDERIVEWQAAGYLLEGVMLYFLITNVIREFSMLRRAIWTLLLAGSLMAGLSIFQKVTHTEANIYGGLAQVSSDFDLMPRSTEGASRPRAAGTIDPSGEGAGQVRAAGPIGETNRYGQVLVVLLPLGALLFRTERSRAWRAFALIAVCFILGGLLLTLSRGSLLAGVIVFGMMAYMRFLKPGHLLVSALAIAVLILVVQPGVIARMVSLERLKGLIGRPSAASQAPDSSAVRRYVLNVAAWHVFKDHPILGVGPGQFAEHYSTVYGNRVGLVEQRKTYRGHNLYLETLAETGLIGFVSFLSVVVAIMLGLWKARKQMMGRHLELADTATGFFLCLTAYAVSAVFAHLSYQRYFWLLMALSSAAIRIIYAHSQPRGEV